MSLVSGRVALQNSLTMQFASTVPANTAEVSATHISNYMQTFAQTGVPMTNDTGTEAPNQTVVNALTSTPGSVSATGSGGIDTVTPGSTLAAAKAALISALTAQFSNTSPTNTAALSAQQISQAVLAFLSQATILTQVTGTVPPGQAVPPPVGPVGPGTWTGSGTGGIDSATPGAGLSAALPTLIDALTEQFSNTTPGNTPAVAATNIANYLEAFFLQAMISTTDSGSASGGPATVATPPAPPNGVTDPPGSSASGTGTGAIS